MITPLPFIATVLPAIGAAVIGLFLKNAKARNAVAFLTVTATFGVVLYMCFPVLGGQVLECRLFSFAAGHDFYFRLDALSILFGLTSSFLWILVTVYSMGYMAHQLRQRTYFTFFIMSMSATMGLAFSGNMITMYIFLEFLAFATYPLVIHPNTEEAHRAGTKYIIYCLSGGALFLMATILLAGVVPTLDFARGGVLAPVAAKHGSFLSIVFFLAIFGSATKAALMPVHSWLPSAMVAPTPVSALLHAVAVVKAGVYGVLRVMFSIYGAEVLGDLHLGYYLSFIVICSILTASVLALKQTVLKRRLAYSTIAQLGFITLGACLLSPAGVLGGLIHIMNHALMKVTLFLCAGMIITLTGKDRISQLYGVAARLPLTMLAFTIGGLGLVGILPINGYITKYFILTGCLQADRPAVAFVMLASSVLNAMYYLPISMTAFFRKGDFERSKGPEAPLSMLVPTIVLGVLCIVTGLFAHRITIPLVEKAVKAIM